MTKKLYDGEVQLFNTENYLITRLKDYTINVYSRRTEHEDYDEYVGNFTSLNQMIDNAMPFEEQMGVY
jgi:hypothetical protein